jgi:hypothetical protein
MSDFAKFWLETAKIQSDSQRMFPLEDAEKDGLMAAYEHDKFDLADLRDEADSVTERCHCGSVATECCETCEIFRCEKCHEQHLEFLRHQPRPL